MRKFGLIVILGGIAFAMLPKECKVVSSKSYKELERMQSKTNYIMPCKLLDIRLEMAQNSTGIKKIINLGYAWEALKDLDKFNINTQKSKKVLFKKFALLNKQLKQQNLISKRDNTTIFINNRYRAYIKDNTIYFKNSIAQEKVFNYKINNFRFIANNKECLKVTLQPSTKSKIVYKLKGDEFVYGIGKKGDFVKIEYLKNRYGWIKHQCIRRIK